MSEKKEDKQKQAKGHKPEGGKAEQAKAEGLAKAPQPLRRKRKRILARRRLPRPRDCSRISARRLSRA
jgi:hypothetical protein